MMHRTLGLVTAVVAAIGAINWGLVGLFNFNLVEYLFGSIPIAVKIIYAVVGICGILLLFSCKCMHRHCNKGVGVNN
jgi:uncharacterized membrane protein YuzA (DUF378 family)